MSYQGPGRDVWAWILRVFYHRTKEEFVSLEAISCDTKINIVARLLADNAKMLRGYFLES